MMTQTHGHCITKKLYAKYNMSIEMKPFVKKELNRYTFIMVKFVSPHSRDLLFLSPTHVAQTCDEFYIYIYHNHDDMLCKNRFIRYSSWHSIRKYIYTHTHTKQQPQILHTHTTITAFHL